MKRYDAAHSRHEFDETPVGDWVKYEDAQAAIQQAVLAEREACAKLCVDHDAFGLRPSYLANRILARSTP